VLLAAPRRRGQAVGFAYLGGQGVVGLSQSLDDRFAVAVERCVGRAARVPATKFAHAA
jgi:hypothetical protein